MVQTRSHPSPEIPLNMARTSNNLEMTKFMKRMAESMEVLRKQNKDFNTRLTVAEAQNSLRDREQEE